MSTLKRKKTHTEATDNAPRKKALKSNPSVVKAKPAKTACPRPKNSITEDNTSARKTEARPSQLGNVSIQIVTGSYERILHGFTATIPRHLLSSSALPTSLARDDDHDHDQAILTDTFLFPAHSSSIRSLAISPPSEQATYKRILATGSSDERVNLYQISSSAPSRLASSDKPIFPSLGLTPGSSVLENPRNRELGSLLHHSRAVTRLAFPTKSKLFSAAEDNTIAITRVRDWTMLSSIKAPVPNQTGRPSGDTAAPGEVPAGVNDFAIHPSMKLMISVGKGEKCMRLWNLVTGKKAGVLNFDRDVLAQAGEAKYGAGEGRRVIWNPDGESFVVLFERGAAVYGMDCKPLAIVRPTPPTKVHQALFVPGQHELLSMSTEDGRVLFFDVSPPASADGDAEGAEGVDAATKLPFCPLICQIPGPAMVSSSRIKDFDILEVPKDQEGKAGEGLVCITASSDGTVRVWLVNSSDMRETSQSNGHGESKDVGSTMPPPQVGRLLGTQESGNRLTCLTTFIMDNANTSQAQADSNIPVPEDEGDPSGDDSSSKSE